MRKLTLTFALAFAATTALVRPAAADGPDRFLVWAGCTVGGQWHYVLRIGAPGETQSAAMTFLRQTVNCDPGSFDLLMSPIYD